MFLPPSRLRAKLSLPTLLLDAVIASRRQRRARANRRPAFEPLEARALLASTNPLSSSTWTSLGPGPIVVTPNQPPPGEIDDPDGLNSGLGPAPIGFSDPSTGRINGIAASPTDPSTIYVASAGGGVWKTTDGGTTWAPLTDGQATLSMTSIALAPSNPNIIYAGTGDSAANLDGNGNLDNRTIPGDGVLKSTDGGQSWTLLGQFDSMGNPLFDREEVSSIAIDPANANTVYVAVADYVSGSLTGNTGIWKSTDGGASWTNTTNSATADIAPGDSFLGVVMDPTNDQVLYAAASDIGGNPGNGVYKTTDGGVHWAAAGDFPIGGTEGRISLAKSPTNKQVLYAAVADTSTGLATIYQTTNAGANWTALTLSPALNVGTQGFYDMPIAVDPTDATGNTFYAAGMAGADSIIRVVVTPGSPPTTTVTDISGGTNSPHSDHHALAFAANGDLLDSNDGGIWELNSFSPSVAWTDLNGDLEITEFEGIAVDPTSSGIAYGGSQDNGTEQYTGSTTWTSIAGGDGGFTFVDQSSHMTVYQEYFGISLNRSTNGGSTFTGISPPGATGGLFYVPYVMDPSNSNRLLYGTGTLYETTDATASTPVWSAIGTPGTGGFNTGGAAIATIAIAQSSPSTVYVATSGGQIFLTKNDGGSWTNVSIPGVTNGYENLQVDPLNSQIAYAIRDVYGSGKIFMTTNGGTSWTDSSSNLPDEPAFTLAIDPRTSPETLYLGNEIGVYASYDLGGSWIPFGSGLPHVQVKQLDLQLNGGVDVLGAGTFGRGLFEIQANTPLVVTAIAPPGLQEGRQSTDVETATFTDVNAPANTDPAAYYSATIFWGDGSSSAGTIVRDASGVFHVTGSHTYAEEGTELITTEVTSGGGSSGGATATATVNDAPLSGSAGNETTGIEGSSTGTVLLGTFTDANQAATVADYTSGGGSVVVNWGDGSAPQTLAAGNLAAIGTPNGVVWTINAAHTYNEEGTYSYTVTVTDDGGASTIVSGSAIIPDATLTAGAATLLTPKTGIALPGSTVVATFTDANTFATTADYTATINWGDGSPESTGVVVATTTPGKFDVEGGHSYARFGVYTTLVSVYDDGGSKVVVTGSATVSDPAITGTGHNFTSVEGQDSGTVLLATIDDPNTLATAADITALLTAWGDSTPATPVALTVVQASSTPTDTVFDIFGHHNYHDEGLFTFSLTVTTLDPANPALTLTGTATVTDAPLTGSSGTELTGLEGASTGTVLVGTFTDSNPFAPTSDFTVSIHWGDTTTSAGSVSQPGGIGTVFLVDGTHTYAEEGTYAVTATVTDVGGQSTVTAASAIIADAALSPSATQPTVDTVETSIFPIPVFSPPLFNGPVASYIDANPAPPTGSSTIADFKATIDWGDGTTITGGTISQPGGPNTAYIVSGAHTYADSRDTTGTGNVGHYPIQVFVVDDGGSILTVANTANVADNTIVLTGQLNPASDSGLSTGTIDTTNVTQPDFLGKSEPLSTVTLSATLLPSGVPFIIGQVEAGSDGSWNIKSDVPLVDGHYSVTATAIDQFGDTIVTTTLSPVVITPNLLIDTAGPVIAGAFFNRLNGQVDYIIRDPVPASGGAPSGVWVNTLLDSSNYLLTKVHANKAYPGKWVVTDVTATPDPTIPYAYDVAVTFNGGASIRGGFYLFTIRDSSNGNSSVQDLAENHLDGEFYGSFPSGNGINGSDFVAELQAYHNKVFAPQTIIGTSFAGNGGDGGLPVAPVHSGIWAPVVPVGGSPIFSTTTSPSNRGGSVLGADPKHLKDRKTAKTDGAVKGRGLVKHHAFIKLHGEVDHTKVVVGKHPKGPLHG